MKFPNRCIFGTPAKTPTAFCEAPGFPGTSAGQKHLRSSLAVAGSLACWAGHPGYYEIEG